MSETWGPWIEHQSSLCPPVASGVFVEVAERDGEHDAAFAEEFGWYWSSCCPECKAGDILRYRIRKPRGLAILEGLLENLPEQVDA